jgi:DNA mismatch repair protein MutL
LARNSAIKAGISLTTDEMNNLIDQLFACKMPNISLQGKPVTITFTVEELMQKFENNR